MKHKNKKIDMIDPRVVKGIQLFNQKKFFDAHEELELAWRDELEPIRNLYRGILQIGVAYFHIQRRNFTGAQKMFIRAEKWLSPYSGIYLGINIEKLKQDALKISGMLDRGELDNLNTSDGSIFSAIETIF